MGPRPWFVALVLVVCGAAGAGRLLLWRAADRGPAVLVAQEVVRCSNGQAVLVLRVLGSDQRLPLPLTAAEAQGLERRLRGAEAEEPLAAAAIRALGGRVLRVSVDAVAPGRDFPGRTFAGHDLSGHVTVSRGAGRVDLPARPQEAIGLALDAHVPIVATPEVLEDAAVSGSELRSLHELDRAHSHSLGREPLPLQGI